MNIRRTALALLATVIALGACVGAPAPSFAASNGLIQSGCGEDNTGYVVFTATVDDGITFVAAIQPEIDGDRKGWIENTIDPNGNGIDYLDGTLGTRTFTGLAPGTHTWDWYDRTANGAVNGPHSTGADAWRGAEYFTFEIPADCVPPIETTTTQAPTTTAVEVTTTDGFIRSTTTVGPNPTFALPDPQVTTPGSVDTTVALTTPPTVATTAAPATTAVVQPTTSGSTTNTLPATGANHTPFLALGVAFLGLGTVAVLSTKRRTAQA